MTENYIDERVSLLGRRLSQAFAVAESQRVSGMITQAEETLRIWVDSLLVHDGYRVFAEATLAHPYERPISKPVGALAALASMHAKALKKLALVFSDQDLVGQGERAISDSIRLAKVSGARTDGSSFVLLADLHRKAGQTSLAIEELQLGINVLIEQKSFRSAAFALDNLAHAYVAAGDLDEAVKVRKEAIRLMSRFRDKSIASAIFVSNLASDRYRQGDIESALVSINRAIFALANGPDRDLSYAFRTLGDVLVARKQIKDAGAAYTRAQRSGVSASRAKADVGAGWWELQFGSILQAQDAFERVSEPTAAHGDLALGTEALTGLSIAHWMNGKKEKAVETLAKAMERRIPSQNRQVEGFIMAAASALSHALGREDEAADAAVQSDAAFECSARPLVGFSARLVDLLERPHR